MKKECEDVKGVPKLTLLCLGQILGDSRESFMYIPNLNLYKNYKDKDPAFEIDIICISDGKFIIGEVKKSGKLFHPSDFSNLEKLALELLPDKIVTYALEGPYKHCIELTNKLKEKLMPLEIDVEFIRPNHWVNEPTYNIDCF